MKIINLIQKHKDKPFFSFEFFPPKEESQLATFFTTVEKLSAVNPLFASVTYGAGGSSQNFTLETTTRLKKDFNLETMAHLTCVGSDPKNIDNFINQLADAGINNVLALRGDMPKNVTWDFGKAKFKHATDLISYLKNKYTDLGVSMAAYPAPHPESKTFADDRKHTVLKVKAGAEFAITQLFFDTREYISLVDNLKSLGIDIPIIPGILPVQNFDSMRRTISMCGANIPGKLYLELEEAQNTGGVEALKEAGINFAVKQIKELLACGAPGVHLYTLNKASTCLNILEKTNLI